MKNKDVSLKISGSQRIVQICLLLFAAIAIFGGTLQMTLGEPDTTPRLDNIHRFMAGIYLACGMISGWMAFTIRQQGTLVYLMAFGAMLGGTGRLISMQTVGLPEPHPLWLAYLLSEFVLPLLIILAHRQTGRRKT